MLVMGLLGQALTDAVPPGPACARSRPALSRSPSSGRRSACEGTVAELFEADGERRARLALTARDETGDVKLAGEAIVAL